MNTEYAELLKNREDMYSLLARFFLLEIDKDTLKRLQDLEFPEESVEEDLAQGYSMMAAYLKNPGDNAIEDLAVDYARVILGAGMTAKGTCAYPYESVYTSGRRLVMQEAYEDVYKIYRAHGLGKSRDDYYEDHIALELQFMAYLCRCARNATDSNDMPSAADLMREQKDFLNKHLANWVHLFTHDVERCSSTDFYKAAAHMLNGYINLEKALLDDLVPEQD